MYLDEMVSGTAEGDFRVSENVASLSEVIASVDKKIKPEKARLLGQLVASASKSELADAIVAVKESQQSVPGDNVSQFRRAFLELLSGLLQGVQASRQSPPLTSSPVMVRERVLNLLATGPQNPTDLADQIGYPEHTVSQALHGLSGVGLVDLRTGSEADDGIYQLTSKGEQRQDDRFFGRLADDDSIRVDPGYDYSQVLAPLTEIVAELNTHAPEIAAGLYPGLDALKDQVNDPDLRAAAASELSAEF
jgi:DNA-binding transcriptional ArsR family regulator